MSDPAIETEIDGSKGRYVLRRDGQEAEMTFSIMSPGMRIVDHTGVPDSLRGTGAGRALVEHLVKDARENGFRSVPLCPFVNSERRKHPEWADVFNV